MVTRLEAVTRIKRRLSFRTSLDSDIVSELQLAQKSFERGHSLPWFLKQEDQTLSFTAGTSFVALPSGFLRETEDQSPSYLIDGERYPVFPAKKDWEDAYEAFTGSDPGYAQVYVIRKETFHVFPTPEVDYDLTWGFYQADEELLSDDSENLWLTHAYDLLIGKAGKILAEDIKNQEALASFNLMLSTGWAEIFADGISREDANRHYRFGAGL